MRAAVGCRDYPGRPDYPAGRARKLEHPCRQFAELIPQQHNIGALAHNICTRAQRYTNMGCGESRGVVDPITDQDARPRRLPATRRWSSDIADRARPEVEVRHNPVFGSKRQYSRKEGSAS